MGVGNTEIEARSRGVRAGSKGAMMGAGSRGPGWQQGEGEYRERKRDKAWETREGKGREGKEQETGEGDGRKERDGR